MYTYQLIYDTRSLVVVLNHYINQFHYGLATLQTHKSIRVFNYQFLNKAPIAIQPVELYFPKLEGEFSLRGILITKCKASFQHNKVLNSGTVL